MNTPNKTMKAVSLLTAFAKLEKNIALFCIIIPPFLAIADKGNLKVFTTALAIIYN